MKVVSIDINYLTHNYFYFDIPVPYTLSNNKQLEIMPISLKASEIFLSSFDILTIDKNSQPDVQIIQMSYLSFICRVLFNDETKGDMFKLKLFNILILCLNLQNPTIKWENNKTPYIYDKTKDIKIRPKEFDEIAKIILHQNFLKYDDDYINPELKKAMDEVDELKNRNKISPSLERKIAIITAHTGLSKKEQLDMSYRSHTLLFEEVCGEVEFTTVRPISLLDKNNKIEHWIFKDAKGKLDGYVKTIESYSQDMGGSKAIKSSDTSLGDIYTQQFNNFNQ